MFDLFRSREKSVRYLLSGILGIIALSMVITLIPGITTPTRTDDPTVAEIAGEKITIRQVQNEISRQLRGKQIPAAMVQIYAPEIIDTMITERAIAYEAKRLGFEITDQTLAAALQTMIPRMFVNGQLDKNAYQQVLAEQGLTIAEFETNIRKGMMLTALQNIALEGIFVPPTEVEQEFRRRNERIKIEYIALMPERLRSQVTATTEELKAYFNSNRAGFTYPEKRSFQILVSDPARMAASITIPEATLKQLYDSQKDRFRVNERVRGRHILLKTTGKSKEEVAKIQAKAEGLLKQVKGGADFAEIAKKNSEDEGSAVRGGDLGWFERGQMVKPFEQAAFSLKPNEISNLVTTEYGFHIVQVQEKQEAHMQSFDEVKGMLADELRRQMVNEKVQTSIDQARTAILKTPQQILQIAQQFNLVMIPVEKAGPDDTLPGIGSVKEFSIAVAGTKKGDASPVQNLPGNRLAFAYVSDVFPSRPAEFEEAEPSIRDKFLNQRAQKLAADKLAQASQEVKAGEKDLGKLAKALGLEIRTSNMFGRSEPVEGLGTGSQVEEAFARPVGTVVGPLSIAGQQVILKVVDKQEADMSKLAAERDGIITGLKQKRSTERKDLLFDSIMSRLIKEGKVKKHEDVIRRVVEAYRG